MSTTTIYRCDFCGDESTKREGWKLGYAVNIGGIARDARTAIGNRDWCPKCVERVNAMYDEVGRKLAEEMR